MEPWRTKLAAGDYGAACDLFLDRYRRLILATIRRTVDDDASADDVFAHVYDQLTENGLARLRRFDAPQAPRARFSTWLVTVVHHLTIDWLRQRDGRRPRVKVPEGLSPVQQEIFVHVFVERYSHAECYERMRTSTGSELTFARFLEELAETYQLVGRARPRGVMRYLEASFDNDLDQRGVDWDDPLDRDETRRRLAEALASLSPEDRLGVQLFVVEEMAAAEVARVLGWPNAKAVYNRVYRALTVVRRALEQKGIGRADF